MQIITKVESTLPCPKAYGILPNISQTFINKFLGNLVNRQNHESTGAKTVYKMSAVNNKHTGRVPGSFCGGRHDEKIGETVGAAVTAIIMCKTNISSN